LQGHFYELHTVLTEKHITANEHGWRTKAAFGDGGFGITDECCFYIWVLGAGNNALGIEACVG
jgi:hypothetical protein